MNRRAQKVASGLIVTRCNRPVLDIIRQHRIGLNLSHQNIYTSQLMAFATGEQKSRWLATEAIIL